MNFSIPRRQSYPTEAKYPWLTVLLDTFAICDTNSEIDLQKEQRKRGQPVACDTGCSSCCLRPMVPFSKLELSGISWYTTEVMDSQSFDRIIPRLLNHKKTNECPFLLDCLCSIYPVRPIACRIFFVFNTPCAPFEDVYLTRPTDIFTHSRETAKKVAMRFLDSEIYGLKTKKDKEKAFEGGFIVKTSRQMHHMDWTGFAKTAEILRHNLFQQC